MTKTTELFKQLANEFNPNKNVELNLLEVFLLHDAEILKTVEKAENELFCLNCLKFILPKIGKVEIDMEIRVLGSSPQLIRDEDYDSPAEFSDWDSVECIIETVNVWKDGTEVKCNILNKEMAQKSLAGRI